MEIVQKKIIQEDNVKPYRSPQQKRQGLMIIIAIAIIAALIGITYWLLAPKESIYSVKDYTTAVVQKKDFIQTTQASGTVEIPRMIDVLSPEEGYTKELFVQAGDIVFYHQILAKIDIPDLEDLLEDQETGYQDKVRDQKMVTLKNQFTLQNMNRDLEALDELISDAEEEVLKYAELVKINASRQSELDAAKDALDDLLEKKEDQEIALTQEESIQALQREIDQAVIINLETKIERLKDRIDAASIKSPMNGEIFEIEPALDVPGSLITANVKLFSIGDPASAAVDLEVWEQYSGYLKLGQKVDLTIGSNEYAGTIISIGKVAQMSSDGLGATVQVRVKPGTGSEPLLLGSTAVGEITLGVKENALLLPRGPYLTTGSERYLYKVEGDTATRVEVTFGEMQGNDVEILSGIFEGDIIITSGYQNFIEYKTLKLKGGE